MTDPSFVKSLKHDTLEQARAQAIPVLRDATRIGQLVPVGAWILDDAPLIASMAAWRARSMDMFLAQFESTPAKTEAYLRRFSIAQVNRILFMIESQGAFLGHVGLANIEGPVGEVDNLMRGPAGGPEGLVSAGERALVAWAFDVLGLTSLFLRGLSHNEKANRVHERLGFVTTETLPLRRESAADGTVLVPCSTQEANVAFTCGVMTLDRDQFDAHFRA